MKVNMNQIPDDDKKSQAKASSHTDFLKKKAVKPEQETDVTEEEPADSRGRVFQRQCLCGSAERLPG